MSQPDQIAVGRAVTDAAGDPAPWREISAGRCARVSYLTHDGRRDVEADLALASRLRAGGHMSPFEHVATPGDPRQWYGNFRGWQEYRKLLPHEDDYSRVLAEGAVHA